MRVWTQATSIFKEVSINKNDFWNFQIGGLWLLWEKEYRAEKSSFSFRVYKKQRKIQVRGTEALSLRPVNSFASVALKACLDQRKNILFNGDPEVVPRS